MMTTEDDDTRRGKSVQAVGNNGLHLFRHWAALILTSPPRGPEEVRGGEVRNLIADDRSHMS